MTVEPPRFEDLLEGEDLGADEEARLLRAHRLLLQAGPAPEVPPSLEEARLPQEAIFGRRQRHRRPFLVTAAALATAALLGWLVGSNSNGGGFQREGKPVPMHGTVEARGAFASIELGATDKAGNWPMLLTVRGLHEQPAGGYYELFLTRGGKPVASCGTFRVHGTRTVVRLNAPYELRRFRGWVVTEHLPGQPDRDRVLLRTKSV